MFNIRKSLAPLKNSKTLRINAFFFLLFGLVTLIFFIQAFLEFRLTGDVFEIDFFQLLRSDIFADFYHVNEYVINNTPYFGNNTSYPPLILFFAKIFSQSSDYSHGYWDMLVQPSAIVSLVIFNVAFIIPSIFIIFDYIRKNGFNSISAVLIVIFFCLSAPIIFNLERANYINFALLFSMFFFAYYDSKSAAIRELSLISLAIATGIKLYPAVFALILLKEKRISELIRAASYSIIMFFLPFAFFDKGFSNIDMFVARLTNFSNDFHYNYNYSIACFARLIRYLFIHNFECESILFSTFQKYLPILFLIICALLALFVDKPWKTWTLSAIIMVTFPNMSFLYTLMFMTIPMFAFLTEKDKKSIDYFYGILFIIILAPMFYGFTSSEYGITNNQFVSSTALVVFVITFAIELLTNNIKKAIARNKEKSALELI